jgi:membrane protease YdiL (CAAX protease family)
MPKQLKITRRQVVIFLQWLSLSFLAVIGLKIMLAIIYALTGIVPMQPHLESYPLGELLFEGLIKAPLIESIVIIGLLYMFTRYMSQKTAMILTAILFGLMHLASGVNGMTILACTLSGYLYTYFYYQAQSRGISGYWLMVFVHFFDNGIALLRELIQYFQ